MRKSEIIWDCSSGGGFPQWRWGCARNKHGTQNRLCWIHLLELSDSQNHAIFSIIIDVTQIWHIFLGFCSSFSEKPQILLFYWHILVFLSALNLKSDFRKLMLLRPFPALGSLFKSLLLSVLLNTAKKSIWVVQPLMEERSFVWEIRRAVLLVEMAVRSLRSDSLKMLSDILIRTRSLYMFVVLSLCWFLLRSSQSACSSQFTSCILTGTKEMTHFPSSLFLSHRNAALSRGQWDGTFQLQLNSVALCSFTLPASNCSGEEFVGSQNETLLCYPLFKTRFGHSCCSTVSLFFC